MLRQNLRQKFFNKHVYKYLIELGLKWYFGQLKYKAQYLFIKSFFSL